MNERGIEEAIPESLILYQFAKATRFAALPVAGGIYDQDPQLVSEWLIIMGAEAEHERRRQEADARKARSTGRSRRR